MPRKAAWLVLILLVATALRLVALDAAPPGLTHDEADHGLDAWGVVNGIRPIYFTVGNGREPLFDYATAGLMAITGPHYLAGRWTAASFSLITLAAAYAWARRAFGHRSALLAAAGLAVSFWAVMTGRQALRSISLPALFALAALFYWHAGQVAAARTAQSPGRARLLYLVAGLFLGATFYTYLPARGLWLLFPFHLLFLARSGQPQFRLTWQGTMLMLLVALLVGLPLFRHLLLNPHEEARLLDLSGPLSQAAQGRWQLWWDNARSAAAMLSFVGDHHWRYNIAGKPLLAPLMSALFFAGLGLTLWALLRGRGSRPGAIERSAAFFALTWLLLGLAPALVTGPDLSTPRIVGLQPVLHLFPALALDRILFNRRLADWAGVVVGVALFAFLLVLTARDYFWTWARHPEVRVQYESALVATLNYLDEQGAEPAAVSTSTPGRFHSPAVALLTSRRAADGWRWFNGQSSLLLPQSGRGRVVFSGFAPLSPHLETYFPLDPVGQVPQPATDRDRPLSVYAVDGPALLSLWLETLDTAVLLPSGSADRQPQPASLPIDFGPSARLLGYRLQTAIIGPGEEVRLVTLWRVKQPLAEAVLFTHVLGEGGRPVAQADQLDAPGSEWVGGDVFLQLHTIRLPESLPAGDYPLAVGLYVRPTLERQSLLVEGQAADHLLLPPVRVGR
jgi:hypothetical protein